MTPAEREGLERTLEILHVLAKLGVVEQFMSSDGIRWRSCGEPGRWEAIMKALKA